MKTIAVLFTLTVPMLFAAINVNAAIHPLSIHQEMVATDQDGSQTDNIIVAQAKPKKDKDEDGEDEDLDEENC
jgi:UTP:GlnB (protein PII) uridylyltransferase